MKKNIFRILGAVLLLAIVYHLWTGSRRSFEGPWWGSGSSSASFGSDFRGVNSKTGAQIGGQFREKKM